MKKLTLNKPLLNKLSRLRNPIGLLSYKGVDINLLIDKKFVAIVGTRKPTPYGKSQTEKIARELAREGVVIVSGLAFGIDSIAHKSALEAGGITIAVLPSGIDNIYPASHAKLAEGIINGGGALISEYKADHKPRKVEFLERNRIIAALSDIVVIPEAAGNSGSLNTAKHAHQMNIPIRVLPGNVTSPMSAGTNYLLKDAAKAITEAQDILNELGIDRSGTQQSLDLIGTNAEETLILQKIAKGINTADELLLESKMTMADFQTALSMLEIQGRIKEDQLGCWSLV